MATPVTTTVEELGDSRVRVRVQVPAEVVEQQMDTAAAAIGRELRVPGFRKGKVPSQVVIRQVGREAVLDEAVRKALPTWYEEAVQAAGVATVGDPKLDLDDLPERGAPLQFSIEVAVVPPAELGQYKGVEVGKREPTVDPEHVDAQIERTRESLAALETVEREARNGDFLVMDFVGSIDGEPFEGGEARGHVTELGAGRLIDTFEQQLEGSKAGEDVTVAVTFPDDYQAEHLAGKQASFAVQVKEVKEKRLPDLDDDFAVEAGGYDSLDELRSELEQRLRQADEEAVEAQFRQAAVDAVVADAKVEVPHELVHAKAHEMWHRTSHRLSQQGVDPSQYLQLSGKTEEELVTEAEPDAEAALKREAVLAAVVKAEGIEVADEEFVEAMREAAGPEASDKQIQRALKRARSQGADDALKEDIAMRKAVDLIVEHAKAITVEQAQAREKLWTPGRDEQAEQGAGKLWTPGS
jgi:trigger factor